MSTPLTYFAPAERAAPGDLARQVALFRERYLDPEVGDALPVILLVLNRQRQVVYANKRVLDILGQDDFACIYGRRPGELFNCIHAADAPGGCGTSRFCENCGALQAVLETHEGRPSVKECRLTMKGESAADFRVWATPIEREGEHFTIFSLLDIQHEKRRQALEKTFYHDLLNTAGGVSGLIDVLQVVDGETQQEEILDLLARSARRMIEEIHSGRALSLAEEGRLHLHRRDDSLAALVNEVVESYTLLARNHQVLLNREPLNPGWRIRTDGILFRRVLGNLVKNAVEASGPGTTVTLGAEVEPAGYRIRVHNEGVLPPNVAGQIFQRSFSTKGTGRGIGTYSVKLFTEKYLGGRAWFTSSADAGTAFFLLLPEDAPADRQL